MRHRSLPTRLLGTAAAAVGVLATVVLPTNAAAANQIVAENAPNKIQDSYVVVLKDNVAVRGIADGLAARYGGKVGFVYQAALKGFSVTMSASQARKLAADPAVSYVEQDRTVGLLTDQLDPPSWGLDRVDQVDRPIDQRYSYSVEAADVTAYVIDTGINYDHQDFGGRATFGFDAFTDGRQGMDCHGHGSHVAGTVGGHTFGVAKKVKLKAVRVLDCEGSGSISTEAAGVDWVTANAVLPAVANMSLYTGVQNEPSRVLDDAVRASIGKGISYVVAAGNFNDDSCQYSPQRVTETINVAASSWYDARASFSSYGNCTDIFAPGEDIYSAVALENTLSVRKSGTSMAAPHVTGAVALYLADNPTKTPAEVHSAILAAATPGKVTNPGANTPNRLLRVNTPPTVSVTNPGPRKTAVGASVNLQLSASGGTPAYTWSATGLPPGLSIGSSNGVITGAAATAGTYNVKVTVTESAGGSGQMWFTWTVGTVQACVKTNGTDVAIPDLSTRTSSVTVSGCTGNASATSTAEVHIKHTSRGNLVVELVAPDGTRYGLKNFVRFDNADNVDETYTVNLAGEARNGTWTLRVQDMDRYDVGTIDTWTLNL